MNNDAKNIFSRLRKVIEFKRISNNEFGRIIGCSSAQVTQMLTYEKNFGIDKLLKIVSSYPEISTDWLLTGHGSMLKTEYKAGRDNNIVNGENKGVVGNYGTIGNVGKINGGKNQLIQDIEKVETHYHTDEGEDEIFKEMWKKDDQRQKVFLTELRGFREYINRQDDYIKKQDEHLDRIIKNSYLRNERNMERIDKLIEQQNALIEALNTDKQEARRQMDRTLAMLEKLISPKSGYAFHADQPLMAAEPHAPKYDKK